MAFAAGDLTDQLMIQVKTEERSDPHGTPKLAWKDVRWIWCKIEALSTGEQQKATGQVELGTFRIKVPWLAGQWITAKHRGRWLNAQGQLLEFTGLLPVPSKDELIIQAAAITV
jgi:head-tail adaptor